MIQIKVGFLVCSLCGHDKDQIYVVTGIKGNRVLLADGKLKTIAKPKLKNIKHISVLSSSAENHILTDTEILKTIKKLKK